jgi:RNA polymerase sigma-70 factor, ECF subfamily
MLSRIEPEAVDRVIDKEFHDQLLSHYRMLCLYCRSLCKDLILAEDLVQETMMKALANRARFDGASLAAWLVTIARNAYFDNIRKNRRMAEDPDDVLASQLVAADNPHTCLAVKQTMEKIKALPERQRVPLLLIADGASYEETAEALMEYEGTIKSRVHRGKQMLLAQGVGL